MANCPNCGTKSSLSEVRAPGLNFRGCPACVGVWLGTAELARILAKGGRPLLTAVYSRWGAAPSFGIPIQHDFRVCPDCGQGLQHGEVAMNSGVPCDRCPRGHGTWIDAHDLRSLSDYLERLNSAVVDYSQSRPTWRARLAAMIRDFFNP